MDITTFFNQKVNSLESSYDKASGRRKNLCYIAVYTIAFFVTFLIAWSPFLLNHKTFVWSIDGTQQEYPSLAYLGRFLRKYIMGIFAGKGLSVPMFDVNIGLGGDVFTSLNLSRPFSLLAAFVPTKHTETLYAVITVLNLYFSGIAFLFLCHYFKKRRSSSLVGAIVYCFSGYGIWASMQHPFFIVNMIQFPLLIVGLDCVLRKRKSYLLIFSIFYTAICGYYFLYMMTIMMFVFAVVRFFDLYSQNRFKEFVLAFCRVVGCYVLGIGLSMVVFLPYVFVFLNSARTNFTNYSLLGNYNWNWWRSAFFHFIAPPGSCAYLGLAAIVFPAFGVLAFSQNKNTLKIISFIAVLSYFFMGVTGSLMNGVQNPTDRWTFCVALVAAFAVVEMLSEIPKMSKNSFIVCVLLLFLYAFAAFSTRMTRTTNYVLVGVSFLSLTMFLLFVKMLGNLCVLFPTTRVYKDCKIFFLLFLVMFNVGVNAIYHFAPDQYNYIKRFKEYGYETKRLHDEIEWELEPIMQENPKGRVDVSTGLLKLVNVWRVPTMTFYNSCENKNVTEFWKEIESSGTEQDFRLVSTGSQTIATTLLSEKYHARNNDYAKYNKNYVPYGYSFKQKTNNGNFVYENNFALPWGYTYDNVMSYAELEKLNGLEKQEAMLQAIAVDAELNFDTAKVELSRQKLPYRIECKDCEWKDGILKVNKNNAVLKLLFDMDSNVEGYVRLFNYDINDSNIMQFNITVNSEGVTRRGHVASNLFPWYSGKKNYLFNLGYSTEQRKWLTITFPVKGTFKLADIELFALPMQNYEKQVNALRAEPLENIEWGTNKISGTVNLSKDKILCMSVPYSQGWTAYVDGEKTKILRGNYMFMALPLKAGHHDIVFKYCSPGIKLGAVVSLVSLIVLILMLVRDKKRKPKNDDERNGKKPSDENDNGIARSGYEISGGQQ